MRRVALMIVALGLTLGVCRHNRSSASAPLTAVHAASVGPQLPNADIFGRPTSEPIRLLRDRQAGEAEPMTIQIDPRCGRYAAMNALYPPEVSEAAVKMAVSALYGSEMVTASGKPSGMWRVESQRFSVMVTVEGKGTANEGDVRVFFTHFIGADPCTDFNSDPPKE
jgi:hypothetical protein